MAAEERGGGYVRQVTLPRRAERAEAEACLTACGFHVLRSGDAALDAAIGTVTETFAATAHERKALEQLLAWDTAEEIAAALSATVTAIEKRFGHLEAKLGVHSHHRIVLRAAELGILRLTPEAGGGRHSLRSSPRRSVLQVTGRDADSRATVEQCLSTAEFPVLRRAPVAWEVAPDSDGLPIHLTPKERQALMLLLDHDTAGPIAAAMGVGPDDVRFHLDNLKGKCGARLLQNARVQLTQRPELSSTALRARRREIVRECTIRSRALLVAALIELGVVRQSAAP